MKSWLEGNLLKYLPKNVNIFLIYQDTRTHDPDLVYLSMYRIFEENKKYIWNLTIKAADTVDSKKSKGTENTFTIVISLVLIIL